jgi:putative FmdB family regulatory protein
MPIYEYACPKCGEFEVTQRITEESLKKCPTCRSKVRKLISNTSFQLKGSGWYITDYARKDGKGKDKSESKSDSKSEGSTSSESGGKGDSSSKADTGTTTKKDDSGGGKKSGTAAKAA